MTMPFDFAQGVRSVFAQARLTSWRWPSCSLPTIGGADVTRVDVQRREDVLGGKSFGSAGPLREDRRQGLLRRRSEQPAQQDHRGSRQGAKARAGQRSSSPPTSTSSSPRILRGQRRRLLRHRQPWQQGAAADVQPREPASADPTTEADFGDAYLLEQGYTIVATGWQFDVAKGRNLVGADLPDCDGQRQGNHRLGKDVVHSESGVARH